jgi:hypothetical protein
MTHKSRKSEKIYFMLQSDGIFMAEGFVCSLDVLHCSLKKNKCDFFSCKIVQCLVIRTLDPDPELSPDTH